MTTSEITSSHIDICSSIWMDDLGFTAF